MIIYKDIKDMKNMNIDIFKPHSVAGCIKRATKLCVKEFSTFFRRMFVPSLLFALCVAAYECNSNIIVINFATDKANGIFLYISQIILFVINICAAIFFLSGIIKIITNSTTKYCLRRGAAYFITMLVIYMACVMLCFVITNLLSLAVPHIFSANPLYPFLLLIILFIIAAIVLCPISLTIIPYMLEKDTSLKKCIKKSFSLGYGKLGYLLELHLLSGLLVLIMTFIIMMPQYILNIATYMQLVGIEIGDAFVLPSYFYPLNFVLSAMCTFLMCGVGIWFFFVLHYAYGSMVVKQKQANHLNN